MVRMGVYDQIKKAFQDIIAPEIHELRGEIRRVDQKIDGVDDRLGVKIDALDNKIDNMDVRLTVKIDALRTEVVAELRRVDNRIDSLDRELRTAIDIRERLAALEARRPASTP
jgi:hypothetical protein